MSAARQHKNWKQSRKQVITTPVLEFRWIIKVPVIAKFQRMQNFSPFLNSMTLSSPKGGKAVGSRHATPRNHFVNLPTKFQLMVFGLSYQSLNPKPASSEWIVNIHYIHYGTVQFVAIYREALHNCKHSILGLPEAPPMVS